MKPATPPYGLAIGVFLVGAAGFAGGAIFGPAVAEVTHPLNPRYLLPSGLAGALLFAALWLVVSAVVSRHMGTSIRDWSHKLSAWFSASLLPLISYFPYMVYRSGLQGESVELPPLGTRHTSILLLIWSLLLLAIFLRIIAGPAESRLLDRLTRRPALTLSVMMISWVAVFSTLDILKDHYMQVTTVNSALFREAMLQVQNSHGVMFSNLLYGTGASVFSVHTNAILFFVLPLFRLWPDYKWLLIISDIALALTAWPAYLIARRHFSQAVSLLMAAMLLLHPIVTAQPGRSDFSELRFMPVLFLTAFYFFENKHFWRFAAISLLMMTIREDMGLFAAMFGIYALMRRRSLKWIVAPLGWGLGWFILTGAILLPRLGPSGTAVRASLRYSNLGSSGSEIAKTILFKPWKAVKAALSTPSHIGAAYGLILTYGSGLALLSGVIVLAIPAVAELMFQQTTTFVNFMALPTVPILMTAFMMGLSRFTSVVQKRWSIDKGLSAAVIGLLMFFLATSAFHTWFNPNLYRPRYNFNAATRALNQVPDSASLMMPEFMLVYAKPGQNVRGFHQVKYADDFEGGFRLTEDYIILDRRIPARGLQNNRYYEGLEEATNMITTSPEFKKVYEQDDIELYVRKKSPDGQ